MDKLKKRILIVEDNGVVARYTAETLGKHLTAARIETLSSGEEAWERVSTVPVDLVITDLRLPQMDGLTLLRLIRDHYPYIQLILMTGHVSAEIESSARQSGVDHCFSKPVPADMLAATVRRLLTEPGSATQNSNGPGRPNTDPTPAGNIGFPGV
jgi:CheY-like chemotaxis protein